MTQLQISLSGLKSDTQTRPHDKTCGVSEIISKSLEKHISLCVLSTASDTRAIIIQHEQRVRRVPPLENLPLTNSSRTTLTGWARTASVQSLRAQTPLR